jgi:lipid-A-disaccharide synthase
MEIRQKLPIMLAAAKQYPDCQAVVAGAPAQPDALYEELMHDSGAMLMRNQTYDLLRQARAACVTSGTATLETALFGVPQVVCYRGNPISYYLARRFIKVKYISLVNLILDRQAVPELIQHELTNERLANELRPLLEESNARAKMISDYTELLRVLGDGGASQRAAATVYRLAQGG